jgi:hypothetical protein
MAKRAQLNEAEIASDACCDFGKWLLGEGKAAFGQLPGYDNCVTAHQQFHLEAGAVARQVNAGALLAADRMLAHGTPYAKASETLTISVIKLFKEAAEAGTP